MCFSISLNFQTRAPKPIQCVWLVTLPRFCTFASLGLPLNFQTTARRNASIADMAVCGQNHCRLVMQSKHKALQITFLGTSQPLDVSILVLTACQHRPRNSRSTCYLLLSSAMSIWILTIHLPVWKQRPYHSPLPTGQPCRSSSCNWPQRAKLSL